MVSYMGMNLLCNCNTYIFAIAIQMIDISYALFIWVTFPQLKNIIAIAISSPSISISRNDRAMYLLGK